MIRKRKIRIQYLLTIGFIWVWSIGLSQQVIDPSGQKSSYYLDLNLNHPAKVYDLKDNTLSVKYFDEFGEQDQITFTICNLKNEEVISYQLHKSYGQNYYSIDVALLDVGETYFSRTFDEKGRLYTLAFKLNEEKPEPPEVEIVSNPVVLNCETETENLVEFYAEISGGHSPFQLQWFVLNDDMSDLLYSPLNGEIKNRGKSMAIQVDKSPSYHVLLQVKDACGNITKRAVSIVCEEKKEVYHSLFLDPVFVPEKVLKGKK